MLCMMVHTSALLNKNEAAMDDGQQMRHHAAALGLHHVRTSFIWHSKHRGEAHLRDLSSGRTPILLKENNINKSPEINNA